MIPEARLQEIALSEFEQLVACTEIVSTAMHEEDGIAFHYGIQGLEFSLMRSFWILGESDKAKELHPRIGDHSPDKCPVCSGRAALTEESEER